MRDRDRPPFSNGTEAEMWFARRCNRCVFEHPEFGGPCSDFDVAYTEDRVPDILVADGPLFWECIKFKERQ